MAGSRTFDEFVELASIRYISHSMHESAWESHQSALHEYAPEFMPSTAFHKSFAEWMAAVAERFAGEGMSR